MSSHSVASPPPAAAAAAPGDDSDDDILVWGQDEEESDLSVNRLIRTIKDSHDYVIALKYIGSKKYGGPKNVADMRKMLHPFLAPPAGEYFTDDRRDAFTNVQMSINLSSRNKKNWTRESVTHDLAVIFLISEAEELYRTATNHRLGRKMTPLEKAVDDLRKMCKAARSTFLRTSEADENRRAKIPKSLSYQKTGQRIQDSFRFNPRKADVDPCPNPDCGHRNTMAVESQKDVNSENSKRRKKAKDGKFDGVSCKKGCFCYSLPLGHENVSEDVRNCMCQIVFEESDRCNISRALQQKSSASSKSRPPKQSAKACFGRYITESLKESTIEVGQTYYSDRTRDEYEQDIATLAGHKLAANPVLGADKDIRTELGRHISLHDQVKYRGHGVADGSTTAMSYKEAYAHQNKSKKKTREMLLGKPSSEKKKGTSSVPDGSSFLVNSTKKARTEAASSATVIMSAENPSAKDSNRARRNSLANFRLKPPPVISLDSPEMSALTPAASDPMRGIHTRLRKRAGKNIKAHKNNTVTMTPSTLAKTRVVHTGLTSAKKDAYITSCVADELDGSVEFSSSQEILKGITDTIETPRK